MRARWALLFLLSALPAAAQETAVVFPSPPAEARIRLVRCIYDDSEFRPRPGLLRRLFHAIGGGEASHPLVRPQGLTVARGSLYVADPGAGCVHRFDLETPGYGRLPERGTLTAPVDVAVDDGGRVWVSDAREATVRVFDAEGRGGATLHGEFVRPTGLVYHPSRRTLFVVDAAAHVIHEHALDGTRVGSVGTRGTALGEWNFPVAIAVDGAGNLLVTDAMNFRVQRLTPEGEVLSSFGRLGDKPGCFSRPKGIAVDRRGHAHVVDALFDAVQTFDEEGRLLLSWGRGGREPGSFWLPYGIAVDEHDRIFVADAYNRRVQVFELLPEDPTWNGGR